MTASDYESVIVALESAERVFASHRGEFTAADLRIRALLNIATKETRRAIFDLGRLAVHDSPALHRGLVRQVEAATARR